MTTVEQPLVGVAGFLAALAHHGYHADRRICDGVEYAVFRYVVEVGSQAEQQLTVALAIPGDWPVSPPPGPHVSPRVGHPHGAVHASPLGPEFEYWSRPVPDWPTERSMRRYLRHLRTLMAQL